MKTIRISMINAVVNRNESLFVCHSKVEISFVQGEGVIFVYSDQYVDGGKDHSFIAYFCQKIKPTCQEDFNANNVYLFKNKPHGF